MSWRKKITEGLIAAQLLVPGTANASASDSKPEPRRRSAAAVPVRPVYTNFNIPGALGGPISAIKTGDLDCAPDGIIRNWENYLNPDGTPVGRMYDVSTNDPRYQACLKVALALKNDKSLSLTGLDPAKDYAEYVRRERTIVDTLGEAIHQQYGYAAEIDPGKKYDSEKRALEAGLQSKQSIPDSYINIPRLEEIKSGDLECRDFSAVSPSLLRVLGVYVLEATGFRDQFIIVKGEVKADQTGGTHSYLVSQGTGNVFEFTYTTNGAPSYLQRINGAPPDQAITNFLGGGTLVVGNEGVVTAYGTGRGADTHTPPDQWRGQITDYDQALVQTAYQTRIAPALEEFSLAIALGNVPLMKRCYGEFPFSNAKLRGLLLESDRAQNLPASVFLVKHGALKGSGSATLPDAIDVPFWPKDGPIDPAYVNGYMKALDIPVKDAEEEARQWGWSEEKRRSVFGTQKEKKNAREPVPHGR